MTEQVLGVGSSVEVRNRFNGRWAPGFVVHRIPLAFGSAACAMTRYCRTRFRRVKSAPFRA